MARIERLRDFHSDGAAAFVMGIHQRRRASFPLPMARASTPLLAAEVNHGRWIVHCPFCSGAEMADDGEPWFYCLSCYNAAAEHRWLPVSFPGEAEAVETVLLLRPDPETRNWRPGETIADLRRENRERGLT